MTTEHHPARPESLRTHGKGPLRDVQKKVVVQDPLDFYDNPRRVWQNVGAQGVMTNLDRNWPADCRCLFCQKHRDEIAKAKEESDGKAKSRSL